MTHAIILMSGVTNDPYMNSCQLQYFQDRLLVWRQQLQAGLAGLESARPIVAEASPDWIDTASTQTQAELVQVNRQRVVAMILEIDAALERVRDGSYGYCIETGEEIGIKRLMAMPTARFSVTVQEAREHYARLSR